MLVQTTDGKIWAVVDDIEMVDGILSFMSTSGHLKEFPFEEVFKIYANDSE